MEQSTLIEANAGDVLIFHALALHSSGPNTSDASRMALFFTYATAHIASRREEYYGNPRLSARPA